jgi:hypothetical protein
MRHKKADKARDAEATHGGVALVSGIDLALQKRIVKLALLQRT